MPFIQRIVEPVRVSHGAIDRSIQKELECVTNNSLANIIRQLSSLSQHAEDMFADLYRETTAFFHRATSLNDRVEHLRVQVTMLNPNEEEDPPAQAPSGPQKRLHALYDYNARTEDDLSFKKGDILILLDQDEENEDSCNVQHTVPKYNNQQMETEGYVPRHYVALEDTLESHEWFHGMLSRVEAERKLMAKNNDVGAFLIRESERHPDNSFVIPGRDKEFLMKLTSPCPRDVALHNTCIKRLEKLDGDHRAEECLKTKPNINLVDRLESSNGFCVEDGEVYNQRQDLTLAENQSSGNREITSGRLSSGNTLSKEEIASRSETSDGMMASPATCRRLLSVGRETSGTSSEICIVTDCHGQTIAIESSQTLSATLNRRLQVYTTNKPVIKPKPNTTTSALPQSFRSVFKETLAESWPKQGLPSTADLDQIYMQKFVTAKCDYNAEGEDELSFKKGDTLMLPGDDHETNEDMLYAVRVNLWIGAHEHGYVQRAHISDDLESQRMSESELMNAAEGSLLDISLEEELCTSERFSCGICEASYARKAYLKRHLKTHD